MLKEYLGKEMLFLDGATGTMLQERGLAAGDYPEEFNLSHSDVIVDIHRQYFAAGCNIVLSNTFGANRLKFSDRRYSLKEIIKKGIAHVEEGARLGAKAGQRTFKALDIGPTGQLLKPLGTLGFEEAYDIFKEVVLYGVEAGADLIYIETMSDTYEMKAAVLAAKENSSLPVFATMMFDEGGKLLTGGDVMAATALLDGLRVDALGINCGMGPTAMLPILKEMGSLTQRPIIIKPNAGLPRQVESQTVYDVLPDDFAVEMQKLAREGAALIGGCCGTTPNHLAKMIELCKGQGIQKPLPTERTIVSAYGPGLDFGSQPVMIGERINPTGKKRLKQALKNREFDYILKEGIGQQEQGAHILDVNVGLPDIDEAAMMTDVVKSLQSVTSLPLQIDTTDINALQSAMRIYNGKPMVNSVNGKQESMDAVFPIIQKYGGVVVGLTLDEDGIPDTAAGRVKIAEKIICEAKRYGIHKKDIVIDVLAMTVSSDPMGAVTTLTALRRVREELGVHTVLGVSNISFGLPGRGIINSSFYTMALMNGLSAGIINPLSDEMTRSYFAFLALTNQDSNFERFIGRFGLVEAEKSAAHTEKRPLKEAIEKGLKEEARTVTDQLIKTEEPLEIIRKYLIPALDGVGKGFEAGTVFLPQLLMSAEAAKAAFEVIKGQLESGSQLEEKKEKIILATVKGDIHDIGKNIVKVLLENYGFDVIDLGKDVNPDVIVERAVREDVRLIGLSALMTTTVVNMELTIRMIRNTLPECRVMVGGAVLNQEYADMIGADFYGKDAMQSVYYAQRFFEDKQQDN